MDFSWTSEQHAIYDDTVKFASSLNDGVAQRDTSGEFDRSGWLRCAEFGIQSLAVPAEHNTTGTDSDLVTAARGMEALGYGCRDNGLTLALATHMWTVAHPIAEFGTDDQKERYLPKMAAGSLIGAHAVTEQNAGSDHSAIETAAHPVEGGYRITGAKRLVTLAPIADVALVFASTDPDRGQWGVTAFLVDIGSPGATAGNRQDKMGVRTAPLGGLVFDDCFVPASNRLGPEGAGTAISTSALAVERCFILASHVGAMQRQVESAVQFATSRKQFGQYVGRFQSVANRIVDMKLKLETSRLLLYKVAWMLAEGKDVTLESALLKLHLSESFLESSIDAIRTRGGSGYLTENEIERDLRDAVGGVLYAGTSDIQRVVVARLMGL